MNRAPIPDVAGQAVGECVREPIVSAVDFQKLLDLGAGATAELAIHGIFVQHVQERAEPRDWRVAEVHQVQAASDTPCARRYSSRVTRSYFLRDSGIQAG